MGARAWTVAGLGLALAGLGGGCSYGWIIEYQVTVAGGVPLEDRHHVVMAAVDHEAAGFDPGAEPTIADASPEVVRRIGDSPGSKTRRKWGGYSGTCCGEDPVVSLFAFIDLDGDASWDLGEPWGADLGNPVTITDDGYVAAITIRAPEAPEDKLP